MGTGKMVLFSVRISCCLCSADIGVKDAMFLCIDFRYCFVLGIDVRSSYVVSYHTSLIHYHGYVTSSVAIFHNTMRALI